MADEMTNGGGAEGQEVGAVYLRLGLRVDDLKQEIVKVNEAIEEGMNEKPVEEFNEKVEEAENKVEELKEEIKKTEDATKKGFNEKPVEDFKEEVEDSEKKVENLGGQFESLAKKVLAAFAVGSVIEFFNQCEDLAQAQQYAEQKLAVTMQNRFNATQAEIEALGELANELENVSGISDQITMSGASALATYVDSAETVKGMLPVMQAIAQNRFGIGEISAEDFTDIGKTVGEVFVEGGLEPLKSFNIGISEADSAQFKMLTTEAEKMAYIVDLINDRVGNINGALSETLTIDRQLGASTNELKETVGSLYQVFIVPMKSMVLSITNSVNSALNSLTAVLGIKMVQAENATNKAAASTSKYFKDATKEANELKRAIMGFDVIQKLNLSTETDNSVLDAIGSDNVDGGTMTQAVRFDYEDGGFADRISTALKTIGQGIANYIGGKFGVAFDSETIEKFVSKLEGLAKWIEEHPDEFADLIDSAARLIQVFIGFSIISSVISWLGNLSFSIQNISSLFGSLGSILTSPWMLVVGALAVVAGACYYARDSIKEAFQTLIDFISDPFRYVSYVVDIFDYVFSAILDCLGNIWDGIWDWMVGVGQSIAEWWRGLWDGKDGVEVNASIKGSTSRPHFATGGYIAANTPTLAVVGDNRKQGEFVLTEQQFANAADKYGGGGDFSEIIAVLKEILKAILGQTLTAELDLDAIAKYVLKYAQKQERATGKPAF